MAMEKDDIASLSKNDILNIIKACSKNNVESLKINGLEISFKSEPSDQFAHWQEIPASKIKQDLKIAPPDDRLDQALDLLMIEDPEAYEQAVKDGVMDGEAKEDY